MVEKLERLLTLMGEMERKHCDKEYAGLDFWASLDDTIYIDADAVRALIGFYKTKEA